MSSYAQIGTNRIHVVAGVVEDASGHVLVAQRPAGKPMAGAWEFPGGKLAAGEGRLAGLVREFEEELGINVEAARPLIRYRCNYPHLEVDLDVWRIERWSGEPVGREGQAFGWHLTADLQSLGLLSADAAIVRAIQLPAVVAVTPPVTEEGEESFLDRLERLAVDDVAGWVCLRRPELEPECLLVLAAGAACRFEGTASRLVLHGDPAALGPALVSSSAWLAGRMDACVAGLHVPSVYLDTMTKSAVPDPLWFGVSCHDSGELEAALRAGADYAFLGPVKPTDSHPGAPGMGWDRFAALVGELALPVYAIGGLGPDDLEFAWAAGAQGIAAIRSLWPD